MWILEGLIFPEADSEGMRAVVVVVVGGGGGGEWGMMCDT